MALAGFSSMLTGGCASPRGGSPSRGESERPPAAELHVATRDQVAPTGKSSGGRVVVELFSSEGCSSCPPADTLLAELSGASRDDGAIVVGLEHHVDYWDRLGWRDPFSSSASTERQARYASARSSDSIFTPEAVVDGVTSLVGSQRGALDEAIGARATKPELSIRARLAHGAHGAPTVHVELDAAPARPADLVVAITESGLATAVPAGENAGSTLQHGPIVRSLRAVGEAQAGAFDVALEPGSMGARRAIVVFVQTRPQGQILGGIRVVP